MSGVELWACDTVTGDRRWVLDPSDCRWSAGLGALDSLTASVPLSGLSAAEAREVRSVLSPWRTSLALVADGGVVAAGPIVVRDGATVRAVGLGQILDGRLVGDLDITGETLGSIVTALVAHGMDRAGGSLPIILPARVPGSAERHYLAADLGTVWQRVGQVSEVIGGPEVELAPRVRADGLGIDWLLRVGPPLLRQPGADWRVDAGGPGGTASALSVSVDGSGQAHRAVALGSIPEGAEDPVSGTSYVAPPSDFPLLERAITREGVVVQATIQAHADAERERRSAPWSVWSLGVVPDETFPLGRVRPGDWLTVQVDESSREVEPGAYRARVAGMSGGLSGEVSVSLVPTLGAR